MSAATERDDAGFSLIEVVVAMAVFTVLATVSLGLLLQTSDVAASSTRRTAATNLVNAALQAARSQAAQNIPDGLQVTTPTVGGITYTVRQTASYVSSNSSTSVCTGTGNSLAYKLVTVRVTWPNMGSVKPVRGDTLRAVGVGDDGLDASLGTVAISVVGSTGQAVDGVNVTLSPGGPVQTTGDDGCAVFTGQAVGNYTAAVSTAGYVGTANTTAVTTANLTVTAGGVARDSILYDTERSAAVALNAPVGAVVPAGLALRVGNSYLPEATLPLCTVTSTSGCATGVPGTVAHLFPESYQFTVGTCTETLPSQVSGDLRPAGANNSAVTIPVGVVTISVNRTGPTVTAVAGRTVTATHPAGAGCPAGETYTTTSVAGGSSLVLPYGSWTLSTPVLNLLGATVGTTTQTIVLSPTSPAATVTLAVAL